MPNPAHPPQGSHQLVDTHTDNQVARGLGFLETFPLALGIAAIALPVGLIAAACTTDSTALMVLAVIAVIAVIAVLIVGTGVLTFMGRLASDEEAPEH